MKVYRYSTAASFVGAIIGAGFASGREIALFFANTSVLTPILAGVFLGLFCFLFLELGRKYNGNVYLFFGKGGYVFSLTVRLCCLVTVCAMIAASESVVYSLFSFRGGGIITGILALLTVFWGVDKIRFSNFIIVPIIVLLVVYLFILEPSFFFDKPILIIPAFTYCAMNIITGGYFVSTFSGSYTKKDNVVISIASAIVLSALLLLVYLLIQKNIDDAMPLISTAMRLGIGKIGNIIMYLAVFSTLTGCLSVAGKNHKISVTVVTSIGLLGAVLGFEKLVDTFYPLMGIVGAIATATCLIKLILQRYCPQKLKSLGNSLFQKGNGAVHSRRHNT
ncbi:hypothetical protein EOM82_04400 [bacterium]|nr:hypothetical protein [bacterium]